MQFLKLTINNFGTVGDAELSLAGLGLVLITGDNKDAPLADSNGAGKSTLLDALAWCLWGQTVKGLKGDEVVNRFVGKNCKVSVSFESGGTTYKVSRYRKHTKSDKPNDLTLLADGIDCSGVSMSETQDTVIGLLGVDFTTFCAMMPGAGVNVAQLTDKQIKDLLENILKTSVLSKAHSVTKDRRKAVQQKVLSQLQDQTNLSAQLEALEKRLSKYEFEDSSFEVKKQEKLKSLEKELAKHQEDLDEQRACVQRCEEAQASLKIADEQRSQSQVEAMQALQARNEATRAQKEYEDGYESIKSNLKYELLDATKRLSKASGLSAECGSCFQSIPDQHKAAKIEEYEVQKSELELKLQDLQTQHLLGLEPYKEAYAAAWDAWGTAQIVTGKHEPHSADSQRL